MTTTETAPTTRRTSAPSATSTADSIAPVRAKRPAIWSAAAIALIVAGALASAFIYTSGSNTEQVLVVGQDIARGDVIEKDDLTTISVAAGQTNVGIPVAEAQTIVGQVAAVDLPTGSLLTDSSFADALSVPTGKALVGLALTSAQMPAQPLVAGDQVAIVPIAVDGTVVTESPNAVVGTVSNSNFDDRTSTTIVDVYVSETVAADLASRAATGTVAIYLTPAKD